MLGMMATMRQDTLGDLKEEVEAEARERAVAHQQKTQVEAVLRSCLSRTGLLVVCKCICDR